VLTNLDEVDQLRLTVNVTVHVEELEDKYAILQVQPNVGLIEDPFLNGFNQGLGGC